jgi:hypothetical protein
MISEPGLAVAEHIEDDDAIVVAVNRYRVVSWDRVTRSSDVKLKVRIRENTDYRIEPTDEDGDGVVDPNRENLLVTIRSSFEWPWKRYLRDLTGNWNASARKGGLQWWVDHYEGAVMPGESVWSGNVVDPMVVKQVIGRNMRLYVWGRVEDPSVRDIYYYDRTYDVEVTIGV